MNDAGNISTEHFETLLHIMKRQNTYLAQNKNTTVIVAKNRFV